jgi:hypothetical protein
MMIPHIQVRPFALCFFVLTLLTPVVCKSANGEGAGQSGAAISGPLAMLPQYQSRAPRTCAKVKSAPSEAVATILVQCTMESDSLFGVGLIQDIKLEIGKSRPFVYQTDAGLTGIDLDAPVYPLQGSYTSYLCKTITTQTPAGKNCVKSVVPEASGWCYRNSFGDWKCRMQGAPPKMEAAGPPTAF